MIRELLKIRFKQLLRIIKEIGLIRSIILIGIISFLISLLNSKIRVESSRFLAMFLYVLVVFFINFKRKDLNFLRLYFTNYYQVIILENIIISLPLLIVLIYYHLWLYLGIYIVLLTVSKQGIILSALLIIGYLIVMISDKKNWKQLIILFLVGSLIFIFLTDKTQLNHTFDLITDRFTAFNNSVSERSSGGSTGARRALIEFGLQAFQDRPLFGYGLGGFSLISPTGAWAENNYIELLVGVGLVGTLIFYSIYMSLLLKIYFMKHSSVQYLLYFFIFLIFIMDLSSICYGFKIKLFTILLISILAEQYRRNDRESLNKKIID